MEHKLSVLIKKHPRIATAVEFFISKGEFVTEDGVITGATLKDSIAKAKVRAMHIYPQLTEGDFNVLVPDGI